MMELAATEMHGKHTYFATPERTVKARAEMGSDKWIAQSRR
jgi:hypothetical protein